MAGKFASQELLVKFGEELTPAAIASILSSIQGRVVETVDTGTANVLRIKFQGPLNVEQAAGVLKLHLGVEYAEPNWIRSTQAASDDQYFLNNQLWGMYGDQSSPSNQFGSQAAEAWSWFSTPETSKYVGLSTNVVGVIDTGLDYKHKDLYQNVWLNQGEIPSGFEFTDIDGDRLITFRDLNADVNKARVFNGTPVVADRNGNNRIDAGDLLSDSRWANGQNEDGNTSAGGKPFTDDLIGWDFVNWDNDPYDDQGHGTHVSGTIGATGGNGYGVAGVNWKVQLLPMKFLDHTGNGLDSNAAVALSYFTALAGKALATSNFVATNNSWGGGGYSQALLDAIAAAARGPNSSSKEDDILFIAAAGNGGWDGRGDNIDRFAYYPASYSTADAKYGVGYDAVIAVASITSTGSLSSFSNFGARSVELGAPGSGVWSTLPGNSANPDGLFGSKNGTSMATPHVAGAVALYASLFPNATGEDIRSKLIGSTTFTKSLDNKTFSEGRLAIDKLLGITGTAVASAADTSGQKTAGSNGGSGGSLAVSELSSAWTGLSSGAASVDWFL